MNIFFSKQRNQALTRLEVLVIAAVLGVLFGSLVIWASGARARSIRINCVYHLKTIGIAARMWTDDHGQRFPMCVPGTNAGTVEFTSGKNAFRHFLAMSDQLMSDPTLLVCPADMLVDQRSRATNFTYFNNSNLSYFVGIEASETNPSTVLSGDRNLTNGLALKDAILEVTTNRATAWTSEMHNKVGNIALADGSVQQVSTPGFQTLVANTGLPTNRLQMPILGP